MYTCTCTWVWGVISCGGDQLGGGGGGKGQVNGGETHIVLCLALNMWTEQDTEILLRSRRRQWTCFFFKLGRRVCKETIVWLLKWPRVPASIVSRADEGEETNSSDSQPATLVAIGTRAFSFSYQLVHTCIARLHVRVFRILCVADYIAGCTALIDPELFSTRGSSPTLVPRTIKWLFPT